jgi:hypothetical protein
VYFNNDNKYPHIGEYCDMIEKSTGERPFQNCVPTEEHEGPETSTGGGQLHAADPGKGDLLYWTNSCMNKDEYQNRNKIVKDQFKSLHKEPGSKQQRRKRASRTRHRKHTRRQDPKPEAAIHQRKQNQKNHDAIDTTIRPTRLSDLQWRKEQRMDVFQAIRDRRRNAEFPTSGETCRCKCRCGRTDPVNDTDSDTDDENGNDEASETNVAIADAVPTEPGDNTIRIDVYNEEENEDGDGNGGGDGNGDGNGDGDGNGGGGAESCGECNHTTDNPTGCKCSIAQRESLLAAGKNQPRRESIAVRHLRETLRKMRKHREKVFRFCLLLPLVW